MIHVTQILDTFPEKELVEWQLRDPKKAKQIGEEAKRVGSVMDARIQRLLRQEPVTELTELPLLNCQRAWDMFVVEHPEFVPSIVGMQLEWTREGIVGHPDWFLKKSSSLGVCDLKCASAIRAHHWSQTGGYSWLYSDELNLDFLSILRLDPKTGFYEYQELTDPDQIDYEVQIWLCYKQLYEHRERVKARYQDWKEQEALGACADFS